MKFVLKNHYANATSHGFSNTYYILAFENHEDAKEYVSRATDLVTCIIRKRDIGEYIDRPVPFSGKAFCLIGEAEFSLCDEYEYRGAVYEVGVGYPGECQRVF